MGEGRSGVGPAAAAVKGGNSGSGGRAVDRFLAGSAAGIMCSTALQPFDVLRTKMQMHWANGRKENRMVYVAQCVVRDEGVRGLWKGTAPTVIRVAVGGGAYFALIGAMRGALERQHHAKGTGGGPPAPLSAAENFGVGAVARVTGALLVQPLTLVKTRMEFGKGFGARAGGSFAGIAAELRAVVASGGARGLFRGFFPTVARDAPFSGLYYLFYRNLQEAWGLQGESGFRSSRPALNFAAGALAGITATAITHPPDIVRTRMQLDTTGKYTGALHCVRTILKEDGPKAFARGLVPRATKRTLQTALTWTLFEEILAFLTLLAAPRP